MATFFRISIPLIAILIGTSSYGLPSYRPPFEARVDSVLRARAPELALLDEYVGRITKMMGVPIASIKSHPRPDAKDTIGVNYYEVQIDMINAFATYDEKLPNLDSSANKDRKGIFKIVSDKSSVKQRLYSFLIKNDFTTVLYYEPEANFYMPIEDVRRTKEWKEDWDAKRKWIAEDKKRARGE